jgi:hypothetical protein
MAKVKFPECVYVRWIADDGIDDGGWWEAITDPASYAEVGETITIARYRLDQVQRLSVSVNVEDV